MVNAEEQIRSIRKIISKEDRKRFSNGIMERIRRRREDLVDPIIEYIDLWHEIGLKMNGKLYYPLVEFFTFNYHKIDERYEWYLLFEPHVLGFGLHSLSNLLKLLYKYKIIPIESKKKDELLNIKNRDMSVFDISSYWW
jgi:hypothetical protein